MQKPETNNKTLPTRLPPLHYVQKITEICYRLEKTEKSLILTSSSTGIELSKELIFQIYIKIDVDF